MTKTGPCALLASALLLESLSPPVAVAESRHGRRSHKRPRPALLDASTENAAAETAPKPKPPAAGASVDVRITVDPPGGLAPPPLLQPPPASVLAPPPPVAPPPVSTMPMGPTMPLTAVPANPGMQQFPVAAPAGKGQGFRSLAIAGAGVVGSTYVLSLILGAASYGAFTDGQWGWFIPVAGPSVVMSGACGNPNGCYFKSVFTYITGPLSTATYVAGLTMALVGVIGMKRESRSPSRLALLPYAERDARGLVLAGSF